VSGVPRGLGRREPAHRAARRPLRDHLGLRPEERQHRDGAHGLRQHIRLVRALRRQLDDVDQRRPARRGPAGVEPDVRVPADLGHPARGHRHPERSARRRARSIGGGGQNAGFPAFFPTNDAVVFHNQLTNPTSSHRYNTWHGATAQVWWSDLGTGTATPLAALNGFDLATKTPYLPTSGSHPDDTQLNYEPTTAPVVSGGYAWVVFTSRRLYGNLATIDPTISDPRTGSYNYKAYNQITPKKLWVAAVDIGSIQNGKFVEGVPPGTDPSHPAFYLPAQEIVAGNSRGFWVLDPCKADGSSCMTGDQCCNGFCEAGDGGLVCGTPTGGCSGIQDKCTTAADCCDPSALCINGFCAQSQTQ
jgi:hypothetical protein